MAVSRYSAILLAAAFAVVSAPVVADAAQRQAARPTPEQRLPLCREAEPGERCRTRNGEIRVRGGERNALGGADPGWGVRRETDAADGFTGEETVFPARTEDADRFGGEDPGWVRAPDGGNFGGEDPGWVHAPGNRGAAPVSGGGDGPEPEAMDCEFCDDDEDIPQGPIDNTPRPEEPAPREPEDAEDDCEWHNPAGGPDQDFCDE